MSSHSPSDEIPPLPPAPGARAVRIRQPVPVKILLVEDHPGDVRLAREALREAKLSNQLEVSGTATEALSRLRDAGAARPDLILLDLNLPGMDGRELLEEIRRDPELRDLPAAVLTASRADADACRARQLGAVAYLIKPVDFRQLAEVVQSIAALWLVIVTTDAELSSPLAAVCL